jgi:hypothetical protein
VLLQEIRYFLLQHSCRFQDKVVFEAEHHVAEDDALVGLLVEGDVGGEAGAEGDVPAVRGLEGRFEGEDVLEAEVGRWGAGGGGLADYL